MDFIGLLRERLANGVAIHLDLESALMKGSNEDLFTAIVMANGTRYEADRLELEEALRFVLERDYQGLNDLIRDREYRLNGPDAYTQAEAA